jgi:hypothetical protein
MKKICLFSFASLLFCPGFGQTATDFTANDCTGTPHTLFTELDAGKVVVLCWVMPCPTCIDGSSTVSSTVAEIAHPDLVFYLVDDYGNSTCADLETWTSTNGVSPTAIFDNAGVVIQMDDYGIPAMFKAVVLGGADHHVFLVMDDGISEGPELKDSIYSALGILSSNENLSKDGFKVYPNPAKSSVQLEYFLSSSENVSLDILSTDGKILNTIDFGEQSAGKKNHTLSLEGLTNGLYFVKLNTGAVSQTTRLKVMN